MKHLLVYFFWLTVVYCGVVDQSHHETNTATKEYYVKQKDFYNLFYHAHQPNTHDDQVLIGREYSIEANLDKYTDIKAVKYFVNTHQKNLLRKNEVFTIMNKDQLKQTEALYNVFHNAIEYDTFYKTACWAREYVNHQMFLYTLSVAILHRPDCKGLVLPHSRDFSPSYYHNAEVIQQAFSAKMQGHHENLSPNVITENNLIIIHSNFSGWYSRYNQEQKLTYFTEDVGLNMYYYYYHLSYPFWMSSEKLGKVYSRRGEQFYYVHQQLLARYYLERKSNNLGDVPNFSWNEPIETGYYPNMKHPNSLDFPVRTNYYDLTKNDHDNQLSDVQDGERRIRDAIDQRYIVSNRGSHVKLNAYEAIRYIAAAIDSTCDVSITQLYKSPQYIARNILGTSPKPKSWHMTNPSALEDYRTSLRDPIFYQLFKYYIGFFEQFQKTFSPYTKEELGCPGVNIESVEVDKLITYFDDYDYDITNVVYNTNKEVSQKFDDMKFKVRQNRLNHKPFTVTTTLSLEKGGKYIFRIYLGPRWSGKDYQKTLNDNRLNYVELDRFIYDLESGKNSVVRRSEDFAFYTNDIFTSRDLYMHLNNTLNKNLPITTPLPQNWNCLPQRLLLPKGWKGGMPAYVYVIVSPYLAPENSEPSYFVPGAHFLDDLPYGYPFNRPIDASSFVTSNMHFEDVYIYHK